MLDYVVSFVVAVLSGLGTGGGGLFVLYLCLIKNYPQITSQGINLVFFICASLSSVLSGKRKLNFFILIMLLIPGIIGVFFGAKIANIISSELLKKVFGYFLIASGIVSLIKYFKKSEKTIDK